MRRLKNFIGDVLGYGRCPVTRDTYWRTKVASVHYSENQGVVISARALRNVPPEQIARVVFEEGQKQGKNYRGEKLYSLDEIMAHIPDRCFVFPRN